MPGMREVVAGDPNLRGDDMTSSDTVTPGRGCGVPVIHVATEAVIHAKARRDALIWLRCVAADPSSSRLACVAACEVRLAIEFGKRPSAGAVAWLVGLCEASDIEVRAEARNAAGVARVKG